MAQEPLETNAGEAADGKKEKTRMDKDRRRDLLTAIILWAVIVGVIIWNIALGNSLDKIISWRTVSVVLVAWLIRGKTNKRL